MLAWMKVRMVGSREELAIEGVCGEGDRSVGRGVGGGRRRARDAGAGVVAVRGHLVRPDLVLPRLAFLLLKHAPAGLDEVEALRKAGRANLKAPLWLVVDTVAADEQAQTPSLLSCAYESQVDGHAPEWSPPWPAEELEHLVRGEPDGELALLAVDGLGECDDTSLRALISLHLEPANVLKPNLRGDGLLEECWRAGALVGLGRVGLGGGGG